MRFVSLQIENWMALKAVFIEPQGHVVQITGKNGQGKSAVINALYAVLFGKRAIPADPVRHGAEEARITLDLGEIIARLVVQPDGESKLVVEAQSGARFPSPQKVLASLLDFAGFDPSEFIRMDAKAQRNELARIMGLSDMLGQLAAAHQVDFENRKVINRDVKQLQALVDAVEWDGKPVARVDVADVMQEIKDAEGRNREVDQAERRKSDISRQRAQYDANVAKYEAEAKRLLDLADVEALASNQLFGEFESLSVPNRIDTAPLQQRIVDAQTINERARKIDEHEKLCGELDAARERSEVLTKRLADREAEKVAVIAAAPLPIEGIGFSDDGVTYQGVPFEQASTAQQLLVSAQIGMAKRPELRLMIMRDASMFDSESLDKLDALAEERDYIVLAERATDGQNVGFVISGGEVVEFEAAA